MYNVVVLLMTTAEVREAFRLVNYKYIHIIHKTLIVAFDYFVS